MKVRLERMSKLIQIYKEIRAEIEMERKKLASKPNEKNVKTGKVETLNHGPRKNNNI